MRFRQRVTLARANSPRQSCGGSRRWRSSDVGLPVAYIRTQVAAAIQTSSDVLAYIVYAVI